MAFRILFLDNYTISFNIEFNKTVICRVKGQNKSLGPPGLAYVPILVVHLIFDTKTPHSLLYF